ncbi:phospholipid-transporting ATPase ABCA3-like isoform X2 [Macrotis lagotis]|uniref:phospholipid-transporting ATPase ABCA3-like isoform X2 n=1 Tax=Macrotis lagotis TaxID=92651 RepID=UPI003D687956
MLYHMNDSMTEKFEKIISFMKRFPFPSFTNDPYISVLEDNFSLLILLSFLCISIFIVRTLVLEKEKKTKEYMLIMGLSNWLHWIAWFFMYMLVFIFVILIMTILFSLKMKNNVAVLTNSDPTLVFFFLLFFAISTISYSFMISVFFSKANLAIAAGGIIYFFSYVPFLYINFNFLKMTYLKKTAFCLLSNVAMAIGILFILKLEARGAGVQWRHVLKLSISERFGFREVMIMLLIDSMLYGLVTWYVEAVFPGKYGIRHPWNFFLLSSYWTGKPSQDPRKEELISECRSHQKSFYIQDEPKDLVAGVRICNLSKIYKSRHIIKKAVNNLSLNMYEGQITVLLGQNGAGKTTTMSILTGLIPPTNGTAFLSGYEISQDIVQIRKSLGLCPQDDILFDYLTIAEHLSFYAQIKGISDKDCSEEINYILNILNLESKRNAISKSLSGGIKRKVSIGIALIGGSKVVMLDEPTSGMDPVSRRAIWDLLQIQKSNRTILLTTHFMDEADLLGDRIAIMAKGELQCCGSSLFLKQKYGAGYHMIMVKEPHCKVSDIEQLVCTHIPHASLESNSGAELSFILPKENVHSFEALFEELEDRQKELGISSFGVSVTTMEEVFLRVIKQVDSNLDLQAIKLPSLVDQHNLKSKKKIDLTDFKKTEDTENENNSHLEVSKFKLHCQQFYAIFIKKVLFSWRNWKMTLAQAIIPLFCVIFIIECFKINLGGTEIPSLILRLNQYGHTTVPFFISKSSSLHPKLSDHISNTIQDEGHVPLEVRDSLEDFLMLKAEEESDIFDETFLMAISFQDENDKIIVTTLFNNQPYHTAPMALAMTDNILYKLLVEHRASITATNSPQHPPEQKFSISKLFQGPKGYFLSISLILGMSFMISSFAILAINERVLRSKHIQFLSGISTIHYWLASVTWDLIIILINSLLILSLMKILNEKAFLEKDNPKSILVMLLLHGWSAIPSMYLMSFFFSSPASGCARLIILNIISGILPFIFIKVTKKKELDLLELNERMDVLFQLLPNYDLAMAFSNLYYNFEIKQLCITLNVSKEICRNLSHLIDRADDIHDWEPLEIGKYLNAMIISGCIFYLLLFFIETNFFWKLRVFLYKIVEKKNGVYRQKNETVLAVNQISFTVQKGECFGLLGFNGAGKTSTFKMLTGENIITSGDAFINGKSIISNLNVLQRQVSYCPQFNALLDHMTGREILTMYARIWGIPRQHINSRVDNVLHKLLLDVHADKLIRNYSGGNKRKLSTGIALIGNPSIVFLDEPSTGMDPVARRLLWNAVTETLHSDKAIIITSHSMEECEALCTKVSIMVNGQFKCLGSPQHLKSKYGSGYTLLAKIKGQTLEEEKMALETFKSFVEKTFPGSVKKEEEHQGMIQYHLPKENLTWSKVFGILEGVKEMYKLDDYSINQISLEQVFMSFAHLQSILEDGNQY